MKNLCVNESTPKIVAVYASYTVTHITLISYILFIAPPSMPISDQKRLSTPESFLPQVTSWLVVYPVPLYSQGISILNTKMQALRDRMLLMAQRVMRIP